MRMLHLFLAALAFVAVSAPSGSSFQNNCQHIYCCCIPAEVSPPTGGGCTTACRPSVSCNSAPTVGSWVNGSCEEGIQDEICTGDQQTVVNPVFGCQKTTGCTLAGGGTGEQCLWVFSGSYAIGSNSNVYICSGSPCE